MAVLGRGALILLVEDEPLLRMATHDDLLAAGFAVIEAADADQAIAILQCRSDIEAVFTDIDMPGSMNGLRLAAVIRNRWPPIKLIVTSGHRKPQPGDLPAGVPFLTKPYAPERMVSALRDILMEQR
ncbi:response regulator [Mesorhizobium sp. BR1-1-16]|uniref:response regulator n=1 Tax=Mesorhizobium sp. BR1-1-16 TaxID=2876653 RepID=UPI001CCD3028|nr:response regulator [Mesorhizobium sp. BR1-1-16]MBZ9936622.1 response regulator [Mesorhizobium sp. BR1-1-16]